MCLSSVGYVTSFNAEFVIPIVEIQGFVGRRQ